MSGDKAPKVLIGEDVTNLHYLDPYEVHRPIKNGYMNIQPGQAETVCLDMLEMIIRECLQKRLKIKNFELFNCIVIAQDIIINYKFLDLALKRLKFKSAIVHQESVMATYGLAHPSACIVDIGADKINICCIDDGMIIPES